MNIRILGAHNCESQTTRCACLLIDSTLAIDAGGLTSNLTISDQHKLKAILLTHQHYDHIRDIPGLALNLFRQGASIELYSTPDVGDTIKANLFNGQIYPKFHELPQAKPTLIFNMIVPYRRERIDGHDILAIPMNHESSTVGYQVSNGDGKAVFYTSDTGPGLSGCWEHVSPQMLIIDVTVPNDYEEFARETGHLTPGLLGEELAKFMELKGYLPQIVITHMDPALEEEIETEVAEVAEALNTSITIAREGMELHI